MSLLKVNEVQNYNGSSLTLTASTVSTSAQLNTGGNISVTGSLNVSDDSTTRSNLGLGSIATQASDNIAVTGGTATLGALTVSGSDSGDLVRITQTGSGNALVVEDSANPDSSPLVVDASGNVGIGTSSPSTKLDVNGPTRIRASAAPTWDTNTRFWSESGFGTRYDGYQHRFDVGNSRSEAMRIDTSGTVKILNASNVNLLELHNSAGTSGFFNLVAFRNNANSADVGSIVRVNDASTNYNTSSDYRLKENINQITDGITRVKELNPSRFNFIVDPDITVDGFIAHEVSNIVPEAISGEKDAVDEEGNIAPQGIDQSKLVPLLTAALQESIALIESQQSQIEALTARIEALEAK
jgi:hypothetical protein